MAQLPHVTVKPGIPYQAQRQVPFQQFAVSSPSCPGQFPAQNQNNSNAMIQMLARHNAELLKVSSEHRHELLQKDEDMKSLVASVIANSERRDVSMEKMVMEHREEHRKLTREYEERTQRMMDFMLASNTQMAAIANSTMLAYKTLVSQIVSYQPNSQAHPAQQLQNSPNTPALLPPVAPSPSDLPMEATASPATSSLVPSTPPAVSRKRGLPTSTSRFSSIYIGPIYIGRGTDVNLDGIGKFKCKTCFVVFSRRDALVAHFEKDHAELLQRQDAKKQKTSKTAKPVVN